MDVEIGIRNDWKYFNTALFEGSVVSVRKERGKTWL